METMYVMPVKKKSFYYSERRIYEEWHTPQMGEFRRCDTWCLGCLPAGGVLNSLLF
jgi:hypothetical protein